MKLTDKIHNVTTINLPEDFKDLLNKGTNFIPTVESTNSAALKNTISQEVSNTLCTIINKQTPSIKKPFASKCYNRHKQSGNQRPLSLLKYQQNRPGFNLYIIDYVLNTVSHLRESLHTNNFQSQTCNHLSNITTQQISYINRLRHDNDLVLTQSDKNMGWAFVPTHWFNTEYNRHLSDCSTYNPLQNFDFDSTVRESNYLLTRLRSRFEPHIDTLKRNKQLLNNVTKRNLQLPYMKLLPKVHKLTDPASPSNLNKLTARPIITAHSWITSNLSKLLGIELDSLITKLKHLFQTHNLNFPLIYNSMDLINKLQHLHVRDIDNLCLTTFDFTSLYTNISHQATINAIINACKLLNLPNFYRDFLLNVNEFINKRNFFSVGDLTYQQIKGVAMGSYHSRQIADLVLLLSEFNFLSNYNQANINFLPIH